MCTSFLTKFYDVLGQVISILDVTTDVMVCIGFYQKDRMVFFGISLTILILACIAYDITFVARFSREKPAGDFGLFCVLLPISPLIPFILYFTDTNERPLSKFLETNCCFKVRMDTAYIPADASKLRKFMEEKLAKHAGFIIEALVEGMTIFMYPRLLCSIFNQYDIQHFLRRYYRWSPL